MVQLFEYGQLFTFVMDYDEECAAAILLALPKKKRQREKEEMKNSTYSAMVDKEEQARCRQHFVTRVPVRI